MHLISAKTSQEGIKCNKAKEKLKSYCLNMYIYCEFCQKEKKVGPSRQVDGTNGNARQFFRMLTNDEK